MLENEAQKAKRLFDENGEIPDFGQEIHKTTGLDVHTFKDGSQGAQWHSDGAFLLFFMSTGSKKK